MYTYIAEFDNSSDAYTFAANLHNRFEYKGLSIILEDVMREREMASKETVRLVFSPEGYVNQADETFWKGPKVRGKYIYD